jgi:hypothetical protein
MMKVWSRVPALLACLLLAGCADGAKLMHEHEAGGVVIYPFKADQGAVLSTFRNDALKIMDDKCGGGSYTILREGETKGRSRVLSIHDGAEEVIQERRWGIQFRCK